MRIVNESKDDYLLSDISLPIGGSPRASSVKTEVVDQETVKVGADKSVDD